jgi:hypothetical protein
MPSFCPDLAVQSNYPGAPEMTTLVIIWFAPSLHSTWQDIFKSKHSRILISPKDKMVINTVAIQPVPRAIYLVTWSSTQSWLDFKLNLIGIDPIRLINPLFIWFILKKFQNNIYQKDFRNKRNSKKKRKLKRAMQFALLLL